MRVIQHYIELANRELSCGCITELEEEILHYEKLFERFEKVADIVENGVADLEKQAKGARDELFDLKKKIFSAFNYDAKLGVIVDIDTKKLMEAVGSEAINWHED